MDTKSSSADQRESSSPSCCATVTKKMGFKAHKRKHELVRDKKEEMQDGLAIFADAGDRFVYNKNSKRPKSGPESIPNDPETERAPKSNSSGENIPNEQNLERCMTSKKSEKGHLKSSKKRHEAVSNGQRSESKRSERDDNLIDDRGSKGQELSDDQASDVQDNYGKAVKVSMDVKNNKKQKNKKKKDRWGQVLNGTGDTLETSCDVMDGAMLDNADQHQDESLAKRDSHEAEYDSKTVCVGGMPYDTREEDILALFKTCGAVACVVCTKFADTQRFKGLAFITFEKETAAAKALSLDGANMNDRFIKVERARASGKVPRAPPKRDATSLSVYVGNLDWGIQKVDIKRFFKGCNIDSVRLAVDRNTGQFRGYGHVDFSDEKSLQKAIKMDQKQMHGRPVKVSYAVPKGFKGKRG